LLLEGGHELPQTVLLIVSTLRRCAPVNGLMNVVRCFDPLNYRAVIATLSAEPTDTLIEEFRSLGVPVRQMELSRAGSYVFGARKLRRLVSEVKPDLVHCHGLRADILAAKAGLECPVVSTVHSDLFQDYRFAYGRVLGTLAAMRQYAALKGFNGVAAVSEPLADVVLRSGVAAREILNGVELGEYYPAPDLNGVRALRANLGWPSDAVVVLHTGVLRNLKNPVEVVTGFRASELSRRGFLVFAGDGPLRAECEKAAGAAHNIVFLGKRRDVPDLLRAADILISASSSEGLSNALVEGCASGIRILATNIPSHRYIQEIFPDQVQIFDRGKSDSVRATLDGLQPECWQQKFLPSPSTLELISTCRMSRQYQEFYADILQSASRATLRSERMVLCQ
jgi:glycosyltransferase involved in cell wall biosynthesis